MMRHRVVVLSSEPHLLPDAKYTASLATKMAKFTAIADGAREEGRGC